jgi:hypothetical protein
MAATKRRKRRSRPRWRRPALIPLLPIVASILAVVAIVVGIVLIRPVTPAKPVHSPLKALCPKVAPVVVAHWRVPAGPIAGFCQAQLINAVDIISTGHNSLIPDRGIEIAVMTAIGESGLRNLDYGDTAGPDSRGLFQQRANWGSLADRMNPNVAARLFYTRMIQLPGFTTLPPTVVAHRIQGNADANYYTQFFARAQEVVAAFSLAARIQPVPIPGPTFT